MFILASKSPRRKELMKDICPSFSIVVSDIDESKSCHLPPLKAVIDIAYRKGEDVFKSHPNNAVISVTAYSIFSNEKVIQNHVISEVHFLELSDDLIDQYIASGSPMDKAGAYGIQDNEKFHIIDSIVGSYTNVVGFPVDEIKSDLITNHLLK